MNPDLNLLVILFKSITLGLGGLISFYAYKAYRRTGSGPLQTLALGFAVVTLGSLFAGTVDQLLPFTASLALVVESLFTTFGFGIILYSLHVE